MTTIAVTGATGFIGMHTLEALQKYDAKIVAVASAAKSMQLPKNVEIREFDIGATDGDAFEALGKPNIVLHLAWGDSPTIVRWITLKTVQTIPILEVISSRRSEQIGCYRNLFEFGMKEGRFL